MAYRADADGAGYAQELRLPWNLITSKPGQPLRCGLEFLWGDPTGRTRPIHRYADNMAPGETSREFFWSAKPSWGFIELRDQGGLTPRTYVNQSHKPAGTLAALGLQAKSGLELRGDIGFILSDATGTINTARLYWANQETNLVNDEPQEAWLWPASWGTLRLQ